MLVGGSQGDTFGNALVMVAAMVPAPDLAPAGPAAQLAASSLLDDPAIYRVFWSARRFFPGVLRGTGRPSATAMSAGRQAADISCGVDCHRRPISRIMAG